LQHNGKFPKRGIVKLTFSTIINKYCLFSLFEHD